MLRYWLACAARLQLPIVYLYLPTPLLQPFLDFNLINIKPFLV